ncbi:MAG TPA: protein-disulfide reductase DsbD domain-containing protein, partial [Terrimicrobiaceae bacterium]|nr:protein-disulfide reductase DsbD domain-containing protein [Terrimicrobiaceae bacterium]
MADAVLSEGMLRLVLFCLLTVVAHAQVFEGKTLVNASLLADRTAITPGKPFEVGLLLEMEPKWHTYWEYPGDAGIPTSITWTLPEGFGAGPIQWPLPYRVVEPGDIEVYAYKDKVLLLTTIVAPAEIKETKVTLRAKVNWLVCAEICIPGSADLELSLPVGGESAAANTELFKQFRAILPAATAPPYELKWTRSGNSLDLQVSGLQGVKSVDLFPLPPAGEQIGHPKNGPVRDGSATISLEGATELRGVLVVESEEGRKGWLVSSSELPAETGANTAALAAPGANQPGLWQALLFGFLGGLILN